MRFKTTLVAAAAAVAVSATAHGATLDDVKAKGFIQCGAPRRERPSVPGSRECGPV